MQSQHDRRAIAMIAVQTPTYFFLKQTWRFGRRSRRVLKKVRTPWEQAGALSFKFQDLQ
jgi:hypothetical protein